MSRWVTGGGIVLDEDNKILLVQNKKEKREGYGKGWTFPKGKVDPGETYEFL
eukprot:TRINITY_DN1517_c0_g1_i2.p2 TRINITY_DN1517_c0_g1~~TRINITY_DN1517_c0_g1_i2.p2  ORF type:complete len:52 (+),score=14.68 TRINITY_DN1517_c0_g1_i2:15-170(+)